MTERTRPAAGRMERVGEIDFMKCVCILLMVVFHIIYIGDTYPMAKLFVYTFHMPVFLIISGWLTTVGKSPRGFARHVWWLFVPYAVMEVAYASAATMMPVREAVGELSLGMLVSCVFVSPVGPYWYLHTLIVCLLVTDGVARVGSRWSFGLLTELIVSGVLLGAVGQRLFGGSFAANSMYFLAGFALRRCGISFTSVFRPSWLAPVAVVVIVAVGGEGVMDRAVTGGVMIVGLMMSTMAAVYGLTVGRLRATALYIGRNTLVILLFSPIFTALAKLWQPWFVAVDGTGMTFMIVTLAVAVAGSLGIARFLDIIGVARWMGISSQKISPKTHPNPPEGRELD